MSYIEKTYFEDTIAYINNLGNFDISLYQDKIVIIEIREGQVIEKGNITSQ